MQLNAPKQNRRKKIIGRLSLILGGILLFLPLMPIPAKAQNPAPVSYAITLREGVNASVLRQAGSGIRPRFEFATDSRFGNIYTFDSALPLELLNAKLKGKYEYLQEVRQVKEQAIYVSDPGFTSDPRDVNKQWGLAKAGFNEAWSKTIGSYTNVVAIIDTGIDATHEDLSSIHFVAGYNLLKRAGIDPQADSDDNGHGTLIAGI